MRGDGRIYWRGRVCWIEYWNRGKRFRESVARAESDAKRPKAEAKARKSLKARLRQIQGGRFVGPQEERLSVDDLLDSLIVHLENKGAKSVSDFRSHLKPVRAFFALTRALDVTTAQVEQFIQERLALKKARATVNRETGALAQAFSLARKQGRISRAPHIPLLRLENARQGFFERDEFEAVAAKLPSYLADVARFAYLTGWRKGEITPLKWESVDRTAREIRLWTSKNGRGRVIPYSGDLADLIERRWEARQYKTRQGQDGISEYVFHRRGAPVGDFKKAWKTACTNAKAPGRLFHDLRRTAIRNMVRAGVPETVAMAISGHRTRSMFDRYNITSTGDLEKALRRTQAYVASLPTERKVRDLESREARSR